MTDNSATAEHSATAADGQPKSQPLNAGGRDLAPNTQLVLCLAAVLRMVQAVKSVAGWRWHDNPCLRGVGLVRRRDLGPSVRDCGNAVGPLQHPAVRWQWPGN